LGILSEILRVQTKDSSFVFRSITVTAISEILIGLWKSQY